MVMVVSSCHPSLHWERHQRLRLRMAIGVVSCEFGDTPASFISSPLPPRSQVLAAFDGYEASLLLFTAVAVSGTIEYMTGYNFVGSSCVEVPVANLSHTLGFLLRTSPIGTRPHPGLLATSALLGGNFCHDVLYFSYRCCALRTPARLVVLRTLRENLCVSGVCSPNGGATNEVVLLLLAPTFTVLRNAPSRSRPRMIERLDLHRTHDHYEANLHPIAASGC